MLRALASHQCVPGLIPGPGVFVVDSCPCSEGFSLGSPVFLPPQKPTFLNSNSIGNSRATGLSKLVFTGEARACFIQLLTITITITITFIG